MKFGSFTLAHPFLDSEGSTDLDQGSEGAVSAVQASAPDAASFLITWKRLQILSASYSWVEAVNCYFLRCCQYCLLQVPASCSLA